MSAVGSIAARIAARPWVVAAVLLALLAAWMLSGVIAPHPRIVERAAPAARELPPTPVQVASLGAEPVQRTLTLTRFDHVFEILGR